MKIPNGVSKELRSKGIPAVAKKYGVVYVTAQKWALKLGVKPKSLKTRVYTRIPIPKNAAKVISRDGLIAAARRFKVSLGCIQHWALRLRVKPPRLSLHRRRGHAEFLKHARVVSELLVKHQSHAAVAKELGITAQRVEQVINKARMVGRRWVFLDYKCIEG